MRMGILGLSTAVLLALSILIPIAANAQTASQDQLRATILGEITADPRSKTMSEAQINSLVDALTVQAEKQGLTATQLTYRPGTPGSETGATTFASCTDISCSLSYAFGLDGSIPIIPIALFVVAALFILIYGIMREMGHPHTQV